MLTREGARLQVFLKLRRTLGLRRGPQEIVILDHRVIERPWVWVFPWTTRGWLNGDDRYLLAGGGPILINRHDCSMRFAGSGRPLNFYIERYEAEVAGRERAEPGV